MRSLPARMVAAVIASVALSPVSAVHAEPASAALRDVPLPFLWPRAGVFSVAAVSDTEAWVAGRQGQVGDSPGNPVVRRRVGTQWKEYPLDGWSGNGYISQVAAYGGEVWVHGVQDGKRLYLARFDGTAFQPVAPPLELTYIFQNRIWAGPAGVWLQLEVADADDVIRPRLFRRVGDAWKQDPVTGSLTNGARDIQARGANDAWTGGCRWNATAQIGEAVAMHWNGSTWTTLPPLPLKRTDLCVESVAPSADGTLWALTWDTLYHWNGTWTAAASGAFDGYGDKVRLDKSGNPLVVLYRSMIYGPAPLLRYSGGTWQTFSTPGESWVHDVSVAPSGRIWATGSNLIDSPLVFTAP